MDSSQFCGLCSQWYEIYHIVQLFIKVYDFFFLFHIHSNERLLCTWKYIELDVSVYEDESKSNEKDMKQRVYTPLQRRTLKWISLHVLYIYLQYTRTEENSLVFSPSLHIWTVCVSSKLKRVLIQSQIECNKPNGEKFHLFVLKLNTPMFYMRILHIVCNISDIFYMSYCVNT